MHINRARDNARVQLHTNIASTYLELGQARMARIYVERICVPLTVKDDKGYRVKGELNLPQPEEENTVVYAELMFVAAQISLAAGNEENALLELYEALCREGDREDLSKLVDHYRTRKRRPARIFRRFYEEQRQYRRKCEGMCLRVGIQTQMASSHEVPRSCCPSGQQPHRQSRQNLGPESPKSTGTVRSSVPENKVLQGRLECRSAHS